MNLSFDTTVHMVHGNSWLSLVCERQRLEATHDEITLVDKPVSLWDVVGCHPQYLTCTALLHKRCDPCQHLEDTNQTDLYSVALAG